MGKKSSKRRIRQRKDGLNSLPDEIIVDILSFLPLKFAVKSAVLSQRWRYLWTQITAVNISLDIRELCDITEFSEILNQVLLKLTSPTIRTFQIIYSPTCFHHTSSEFQKSIAGLFDDKWFSEICGRKVEEIELLYFISGIPLPTCLLKSKSFVSLELNKGGFLLSLPDDCNSINLPHLKKLIVQKISPSECVFIEKLIKFCPSLEHLSLFSCELPRHPFSVCGMNLKILLIDMAFVGYNGKFIIDTPKLEYLNVQYGFGFSLNNNDMALAEASMERFTSTGDGWCLTSAQYVTKSIMPRPSFEIQMCSQNSALIKHPYLTRLALYDGKTTLFTKRFIETLHCCPVLETLFCRFENITKILPFSKKVVPECLLTHMKKIQINTHSIHRRTLKLIKFLLCKALVLELLIFRRPFNPIALQVDQQCEELIFCQKMYACQRSSSQCQIEFSGHHLHVPKEGIDHMSLNGRSTRALVAYNRERSRLPRVLIVEDTVSKT